MNIEEWINKYLRKWKFHPKISKEVIQVQLFNFRRGNSIALNKLSSHADKIYSTHSVKKNKAKSVLDTQCLA